MEFMNPWDGMLVVSDNRTGQDFLLFTWEFENGFCDDENYSFRKCGPLDFFTFMRYNHGLSSS